MSGVTWLHLACGVIALLAGTAALAVRKGARIHVAAGIWFCIAMFILGLTASILAPMKSTPGSPTGGIMVCYFIATAWMAARRRSGVAARFEKIACAFGLSLGAAIVGEGFAVARAPPGLITGPPGAGALFVIGAVCLLAGLLDLRFVLLRKLSVGQRTARHLWRMCFAFFFATGSFFLGQQDVMPETLQGSPFLVALAFLPFALMLFWLVRVRQRPAGAPHVVSPPSGRRRATLGAKSTRKPRY